MNFIPDTPPKAAEVPYFENARESDGWQGQTTGKSIDRLKTEIISAVGLLGGMVTGFQRGKFERRLGFRVHYVIERPDGIIVPGRIDVAALPLRYYSEKKQEQSLRMALFMLRDALKGTWFLQQLSPGYSALMPFMLTDSDKTISQLWADSPVMQPLLPPGSDEFIEGEISNGL